MLAHLSPAALSTLRLGWAPPAPDAAAMAALARLNGLTRLHLERPLLPPSTADVLPSLPQLQTLHLAPSCLPAGLLAAVVRLPALVDLSCSCNTLPPLEALPALSQLTHLAWTEEKQPVGHVRPDVRCLLAQLPALQSWEIGSTRGSLWRGCMKVRPGSWVAGWAIGGHTALASCRLLHTWALPAAEPNCLGSTMLSVWACCWHLSTVCTHCTPSEPQIAGATLNSCRGSGRVGAAGTRELALSGIRHLPSLQRLAEAVLPAGTPPSSLQSLSIFHSRLPTSALLSCAYLA